MSISDLFLIPELEQVLVVGNMSMSYYQSYSLDSGLPVSWLLSLFFAILCCSCGGKYVHVPLSVLQPQLWSTGKLVITSFYAILS